jgi:serine/threonine protein kinase
MNEVRAIDKLCKERHENIVAVFGHGWLNSSYYYFDMELCDVNLEHYISGKQGSAIVEPYNNTKVWDIITQITAGLDFIHNHAEVHRDLKPRNGQFAFCVSDIAVLFRVKDQRWKITDFGLSAEGSSRRAHTTRYARGTASYRAPELLNQGGYNNKVDIWALGCILYELVARKQAFSGDHNVFLYGLPGGESQLNPPEFSPTFNAQTKCVLLELLHAMLQVDGTSRPSTKDILEALPMGNGPTYAGDAGVWVSDCQHPFNWIRTGEDWLHPPPDSLLWTDVIWRRHWYQPFPFANNKQMLFGFQAS